MLLQADTPTDIPQCSQFGPQRQGNLATHPCNLSPDGRLHHRHSNRATTKNIHNFCKTHIEELT